MLVPLILYSFVAGWTWLTARLKTKKHNSIRIFVAVVFVIFNLVATIVASTDEVIKEDDSAYTFLLFFYITFLVLWVIRLISDLAFASKNTYEESEEVLEKLKEKYNI